MDKEVALSFWTMLDAVAVRPLCCRVHIMELGFTTVDIVKMLVFIAQVYSCGATVS